MPVLDTHSRRSAATALCAVAVALLTPALSLLHFHAVPHARSETSGRLRHIGRWRSGGCSHGHHDAPARAPGLHSGGQHAAGGGRTDCPLGLYLASQQHPHEHPHWVSAPDPPKAAPPASAPSVHVPVTVHLWMMAPKNSPPQV